MFNLYHPPPSSQPTEGQGVGELEATGRDREEGSSFM